MTSLLELREYIKNFYVKYELYITYIWKFLLSFIAFVMIGNKVGYQSSLTKLPILLMAALLCSIMPTNFMVFVSAGFILGHLYKLSLQCAVIALIVFLLMFLLYFRFSPKDTLAVMLTPMAFYLGVPYVMPIARSITEKVLANPMPRGVCLNVNIPDVAEPKGIRICRQADGYWENEYHYIEGDEQTDMSWFQVTGTYINNEPESTDTDRYWLEHDYVSVVPTTIDQTAYRHFDLFDYLVK